MTVQIDSPAQGATDVQGTHGLAEVDQLHQEVLALDAQILAAVARRSELARQMTGSHITDVDAATAERFEMLGEDGYSFSRMLTRLGRTVRK